MAKVGHPLNTTRRILLLMPRGRDRVPGFFEMVRALKLMTNRLGAEIESAGAQAATGGPLPAALTPESVVLGLDGLSCREALARVLGPDPLGDPASSPDDVLGIVTGSDGAPPRPRSDRGSGPGDDTAG